MIRSWLPTRRCQILYWLPFLAEYDHAAVVAFQAPVDLRTRWNSCGIRRVPSRDRAVRCHSVAAKACVASAILCVLFCIVALCRPYSSSDAWKGPIKLTLILLALRMCGTDALASSLAIWQSDGSYVDLPEINDYRRAYVFRMCPLAVCSPLCDGFWPRPLVWASGFDEGKTSEERLSGH